MDTKNADKKFTLMHFLVQTVQEKFPDIINFDSELRFIEKAALGEAFLALQGSHRPEKYLNLEGFLEN